MKKLVAIVSIIAFTIGCSESEDNLEVTQENLVGNWKLIQAYNDPGDGSGDFEPVQDGYRFTLNEDGTFTSERLIECATGTYTIEDNTKLVFNYDCDNFTEVYIDIIRFSGNDLITSPREPFACIEGCSKKFSKNGLFF
ncbi:lipocalin family protein [Patiriisocius hiemis]|uniref:Glycoside hydrolase family 43 C-terminal domain-containing protein n=1 Tax=Patiriisocius hiemis TaxID=3075604 RepID=A0ABU2Y8D7_9FLAO|nr:lipocalin family protein [Constantimarinum sp. W242]MDT0554446.1 glycoside hydrolase family 43 C-terminal domain-containing protein [Constantimarinum sp. W242]